jgi:hypothetical protein
MVGRHSPQLVCVVQVGTNQVIQFIDSCILHAMQLMLFSASTASSQIYSYIWWVHLKLVQPQLDAGV